MWLQTVFENAANGAEAILPIDLLPFGVGAPVIRNGNLINADAETGYFCGDLGLEAKAVLFDAYALYNLATEHLIACLHIREVQVGEHVGE